MSDVTDILDGVSRIPPPQISDERVFITGVGGSIGSALVDYLGTRSVFGCDVNEDAIHRRPFVVLSDFVDCVELAASYDVIVHAAAFKHLPMAEDGLNAKAYINNNFEKFVIFCGKLLALRQRKNKKLLLISTDKAAGKSTLGLTKRLAEQFAVSQGFHALRLVNVAYSRGSVLDHWCRDSVLHCVSGFCTRYFMTFKDACAAIVSVLEQPPGLYTVLGMPEIQLLALAEEMAKRTGKQLMEMELRRGEVSSEDLIGLGERLESTSNPFLGRILPE